MSIPRRRRNQSDADRSIKEDKKQAAEKPVAGWILVMNGKQKGEDYRIREGKNYVGSTVDSTVLLTDPYISERHASITLKRTGPTSATFRVFDLDSTNGTFHNAPDEQIQTEELVDNDVVFFGQTQCKFKCVG